MPNAGSDPHLPAMFDLSICLKCVICLLGQGQVLGCRLTDALTHLSSLHHADHELAVKALEELASPLISDGTWWNVDGTWWDIDELSGEAITHMAHAAYWLAVLRSSGLLSGVIAQNDEIAYKLLQGAAARGLTDAHQALGYRHATGYKNKTDCELAYSHLKVNHCCSCAFQHVPHCSNNQPRTVTKCKDAKQAYCAIWFLP
jgi:hypothetical protein